MTVTPLIPVLRVLTAIALGVVAFAHLDVADNYAQVGSEPLTLQNQFYIQATAAVVLAIAVLLPLVRSWGKLDPLVWAAAAGFGVMSLGPLVYSRYRALPFPGFDGFQEPWSAPRAVMSAVSETSVIVLAGVGLLLALQARRPRTTTGTA